MMKIQIKNLGALRQAEFELGNLTILCGHNNTGKTYATYALLGFLSRWREIFSIRVHDNEIDQLLTEGTVNIEVTQYFQNATKVLSEGCQAYTEQFSMIFAAPVDRFKQTEFQVSLDWQNITPTAQYEHRIRSADRELFFITKNEGNTELIVTLLVEKDKVKIPKDIITRIIDNALKDIIFGHLFHNPFIASAERTGAAIFRKELNFARNRLLEEMSQVDKNVNPMELLNHLAGK